MRKQHYNMKQALQQVSVFIAAHFSSSAALNFWHCLICMVSYSPDVDIWSCGSAFNCRQGHTTGVAYPHAFN
jgi:hypothetical protein